MMISKSFMPSVLILAISTVMLGCGGGGGSGGDSSSSNGGGTGNPDNGNPKPVTCAETQYLEEGVCKNKAVQNIQSLPLSMLIQGQSYPLSLQTDQGLAVTFSSNTPNICNVSGNEVKALKVGQCTLALTQAGTAKVLPLNSRMTVNVTCAADQYLENNVCVTKVEQTITPLKIKYILTDSVYSLDTESSAKLPVTISSLSTATCTYSQGELKGIGAGICTLKLTQDGDIKTLVAESKTISFDVFKASSMSDAPNINNCYAGKLSAKFRNEFLNEINKARTLHGLPSITYDYAREDEMMQTALILAANNILTHYPEPNTDCYSDIGAVGAKTSSLEMGVRQNKYDYSPAESITNMVHDKLNLFAGDVGHRLWMLNPFLQKSAYGSVNAPSFKDTRFPYVVGTSYKVVYPFNHATTAPLGVIAYPYHNYPAKYYMPGSILSISILTDQKNFFANRNVDYAKATVVVTERSSGVKQKISNIRYENIGVPNHIQFSFDDLKLNVIYDVKLSNVLVNGQPKEYSYWFNVNDR
ncbi:MULTISPECIES: CAP domain-containing protein [Acinetobacter calcoaceticus/baumannii complex]|uniref:CAP domain-containing protein n=1 Tax=Acinetobacter calcoaceticus/baumannii complex TaxID=909768 RepID=UPI0005EB6475|nr:MULTISPECIES: CAP domain-containing protein [Acinetobacter calcoaceticus/baumannii complex]MCG5256180.1 CAP domain-containing protein [Acinetobacter pittii]